MPPARVLRGRARARCDAKGEIAFMNFLAGQCVGLVREIKPTAEIVREIVQEAARILTARVQQFGI